MKKLIIICLIMAAINTNAQTKDYSYKQDKAYFIFAPEVIPKFGRMDAQLAFRIVKRVYLGGEFTIDDVNKFDFTYGGFVACKFPIDNHFSVWGNTGYYNAHISGYTGKLYTNPWIAGDTSTYTTDINYPSTSTWNVKWAIGANWVAGNGLGITLFTQDAKTIMIGWVIGH